ncbi:MAG TPA: hypothetical protein VGR25_06345 [bacterium]|jgi:hypothetical protein|nr:hypothetical protein [bacterium]
MEFLRPFLRYWSLTLAVFVFYLFMFLAALVDVAIEVREEMRKRRAAAAKPRTGPVLDRNPLKDRTIAQTFASPGQQLDPTRQWVRDHVAVVLEELGINRAQVLVLEDSKHHPFIQISDGIRLRTYRIPKEAVEAGIRGEGAKIEEIKTVLRGHLAADFLGQEDRRPPVTTELAREAASKAPAARPAAAAAPSTTGTPPPAETTQGPSQEGSGG